MVEINNQNLPSLSKVQDQVATQIPQVQNQIVQTQNQTLPEDEVIGKALENPGESVATQLSRTSISVAELLTATPLLLGSLLNQADNITKYGANRGDEGFVGFLTSIIETLSLPVRTLVNKFVIKSNDPNDVSNNKRSFLFDDVFQRLLHPNIAKEFTSFLFTFRRAIFNFFPNVFTVPSEEHNPYNPEGKVANQFFTKFLKTLSTATSPIRFFTSLAGLFILSPAKLLSSIYAYTGNQKLFDSTKELSSIIDIVSPIIANLSSTFSTAKAYWDSYTKKESTLVTFGKYNLTNLNLIQGVLGSVLSVPQFFGAIAKINNKITDKDENDNYKVVNEVKNLVGEIAPKLKALNLFGNQTVASIQDYVGDVLSKFIRETRYRLIKYSQDVFNSNSLLQNFASKFRPKDLAGNVVVLSEGETGFEKRENKYAAGSILKSKLFSEIYDLLNPLQSLLMLLPNAFVSLGDPYITDNAIRPFRVLDRLVGINSSILSIPNYFVYALSTRIPQMVLKYFEIKQRRSELSGKNDGYEAFDDFNNFIEKLKTVPIMGSSYLSKVLSSMELDSLIFKDPEIMEKTYEHLEKEAKDQESSVKASELVSATRIGMRTLLNHKLFNSERDPESGLTAEEKSRQKIYNSLGTFKEGIARIPVIGWVAAPFLEMFRGMYKVDTKRNRKVLPGISAAFNKTPSAKAANPLAALANAAA